MVAGAARTLALPWKWHWNIKFSILILIKEAKVWFWIYGVARNVRGGSGLQVLDGLGEMYRGVVWKSIPRQTQENYSSGGSLKRKGHLVYRYAI
jgi:hypothetical protein